MEIRPVRPEEAVRIRALRLRALRDAPQVYFASVQSEERLPMRHWAEWATSADRVMFVAVEDGCWVGMGGAVDRRDAAGTVSLWCLWVAPEARRRGVARRLVEARVRWARDRGAARLEVAIAKNNKAAKSLYRDLGFVPIGDRRAGVFLARAL